jgi:hypothetical protein
VDVPPPAVDPTSVVLREQADDAPESVILDLRINVGQALTDAWR